MHPSDYAPAARRRRPTGNLRKRKLKSGATSYGFRFAWRGDRPYFTIGSSLDGWTEKKARAEMERLVALAWHGAWDPAADDAEPDETAEETFGEFARGWLGRKLDGLSENGKADLTWAVEHLVGWFDETPLSAITVEEIETRFVVAKLTRPRGSRGPKATEPLSPTSVRKFVRVLSSILADAVRYDRIPRNPADGVKVKSSGFKGTALDRAEAIVALLDAAGAIDAGSRFPARAHGRALVATLVFAGLRIDEALSLRWRDVRLADGYLRVGRAKTAAGVREVDLLAPLREALADLKARRDPEPGDLVFATSTGGKTSPSNVRVRLLGRAAERASEALVERGTDPLPRLTPHSLRRTFASVLFALGRDPLYVAEQLGHTDPGFSLKVYGRVIRRKDGERERLRALVEGEAAEVPVVVEVEVAA